MIWTLLATVAALVYLLVDRHLPMLIEARSSSRPLLRMPRLFADRTRSDP